MTKSYPSGLGCAAPRGIIVVKELDLGDLRFRFAEWNGMSDSGKRLKGMSGKLLLGMVLLVAGISGHSISAQEEPPFTDPVEKTPSATGRSLNVFASEVDGQSDSLPYHVGERLAYRISWAETLEAGIAELRVTSRDSKGSGAYRLVLDASSTLAVASVYRLQFHCFSVFDPHRGVSQEYRESFKENGRTVRESVVFNPSGKMTKYLDPRRQASHLTFQLGAQDPVSAIYLVRSLGLKPGLRVLFPIVEGGETYEADVKVAGSELISTALGSFATHRVEVALRRGDNLLRDRKMSFWFTRGRRRIPVLASVSLPFGSLLVELTSVSS